MVPGLLQNQGSGRRGEGPGSSPDPACGGTAGTGQVFPLSVGRVGMQPVGRQCGRGVPRRLPDDTLKNLESQTVDGSVDQAVDAP